MKHLIRSLLGQARKIARRAARALKRHQRRMSVNERYRAAVLEALSLVVRAVAGRFAPVGLALVGVYGQAS